MCLSFTLQFLSAAAGLLEKNLQVSTIDMELLQTVRDRYRQFVELGVLVGVVRGPCNVRREGRAIPCNVRGSLVMLEGREGIPL